MTPAVVQRADRLFAMRNAACGRKDIVFESAFRTVYFTVTFTADPVGMPLKRTFG